MQHPILQRHHLNNLDTINQNKTLISQNLTELEIQELYNKKYNLT